MDPSIVVITVVVIGGLPFNLGQRAKKRANLITFILWPATRGEIVLDRNCDVLFAFGPNENNPGALY